MKDSLGRDLDPGPLPYQGNALPGWATKALRCQSDIMEGFIKVILKKYDTDHLRSSSNNFIIIMPNCFAREVL